MIKKEKQKPIFVGQNLYIKPSYIVSIPEFQYDRPGRSVKSIENEKNLLDNSNKGKLSSKGISNLRNAINWLCLGAKSKRVFNRKLQGNFLFKVSFITLTLPDTSSPIDNKQFQTGLLNPFLTYAKKYFGLKNYVWKLEFQKNGKLHAHITCDTFIDHKQLRACWNRLLERRGYLNEFYSSHGHKNPNSTDVHSIRKVKDLAAYICKYMSKQATDLEKIKGRIWGCNYELSRANKTRVHVPAPECSQSLRCLFNPIIRYKNLTRVNPVSKKESKVGEIYFLSARNWIENLSGVVKSAFTDTIQSIRNSARHFYNFELT